MASAGKICCVCSTDVSAKKRVKDPVGKYYCEPCYAARRQQAVAVTQAPPAPAPRPVPPVAPAAEEDDGLIGLAEERKRPSQDDGEVGLAEPAKGAAAVGAMFACADCKKIIPEKQIRNDDGEFVCLACFSKRRQAAKPGAKPKPLAKEIVVDENPETWKDTLVGGLTISAGVLVLSLGVFLALHLAMPSKEDMLPPGILWAILYTVIMTVAVVLRAAALMFSMVIAAQMLGGIDFGYIGSALWKALSFVLGFAILKFFSDRFETLGMFAMGFQGLLLLLGFMAVFKIDMFEAMLLSVVNFFLFIGISIGLGILLLSLAPPKPVYGREFGPPPVHAPAGGGGAVVPDED